MSDLTIYFAYGSNLNLRQMARRCPGHRVVGRAVLRDHRLCFPRPADDWQNAGVAGIESCTGDLVEGAVYELSAAHVAALDAYEGIEGGEYTRTVLAVELFSGELVQALTYLATPAPGGPFAPSREYLNAILAGAADHGLSEAYLARLRAIATAPK